MKVAILGCGHISEQHVRTLNKISSVDLVAVCDQNIEHAQALSKRHQIPEVHKDIDELLARCNPDVVHILTPPQTHKSLAVKILSTGCNVLIEKPIALNAQDANDIVTAGKKYAASVSVCHNFLYMPAMQKALYMIKNGKLGKIISAEAYWRVSSLETDSRPDAHGWVESMPGGIFHEVGPHVIYLLRAILGDLEVTSASYADNGESKDELRVQLTSGSKLAALTISGIEAPIQKYIRVFGTQLSLHIDLGSNVLVRLRSWGKNMPARALLNVDYAAQLLTGTTSNVALAMIGQMPRSHPRFMQAYYQSLLNNQQADVSGEDGFATTKVLDQIWAQLINQESSHKESN